MGIDIYLKWEGMTEKDKKKQYTGMSTMAGKYGYLREAYHGGPYATKILVREAFESNTCEAEIPAEVMRERLTHVTEPARGRDDGHKVAEMLTQLLKTSGLEVTGTLGRGLTEPMTVEEAVYVRYGTLYPEAGTAHADEVVKSFRAFVSLAEKKEKETGRMCTVYASY